MVTPGTVKSQTRTVLSRPPDARRVPSGLNSHRPDHTFVASQRLGARARVLQILEMDDPLPAGCDQPPAIGAEGDFVDPALHFRTHDHRLGVEIARGPKGSTKSRYRSSQPAYGQGLTIRAERCDPRILRPEAPRSPQWGCRGAIALRCRLQCPSRTASCRPG